MSALQQMVLFVFKWTQLAVIVAEAWVGMVLFSLIKIFKEKTLYMTVGPRPGTVCVSPILSSGLTNMSRTATFTSLVLRNNAPPHTHTHTQIQQICMRTFKSRCVFTTAAISQTPGNTWVVFERSCESVYSTSGISDRVWSLWVSKDLSVF